MCGIVYAHDFTGSPVNNGILQQFDKQRSRGTEGFGLFDGQELNMVHASKEDKILKWLVKYPSNMIMFHHRNPTSTINVKRAAHPFSTKEYFGDNQYILVHNGMISNSRTLVDDHEALGIVYQSELQDGTFNDSESLLWDLALFLEGKKDALEAKGMIAFVCIKLKKGKLDKLYFGRNSSAPLKMFRDKAGIALSSEGTGESIDVNQLYTWNYDLKRLTKREVTIPGYYDYNSHYTAPDYPTTWDAYGQPVTPTYKHTYDGQYANSTGRESTERHISAWERDYGDDHGNSESGNWLPGNLRQKWQRYLDNKYNTEDYVEDAQTGMYLPETASRTMYDEDNYSFTEEEIDERLETFSPRQFEIDAEAVRYLMKNKGNFEVSYQEVESDYQQIEEDWDTEEEYTQMLLLEKVLDSFSADPEWVDDDSVSSIWEALCNQTALIAKNS